MEYSGIYARYTVLGLASVVLYLFQLSDLLSLISVFTFVVCCIMIMIASISSVTTELHKEEVVGEEKPGHAPDMSPKTALTFGQARASVEDRYLWQAKYLGKHSKDILKGTSVAVVGLGNTGYLAAEMLVRAGIGRIIMFDDGLIMPRDRVYPKASAGKYRASEAYGLLSSINREVTVVGHDIRIIKDNISLLDTTIVIDCTDDFYTKLQLHGYCKDHDILYIISQSNFIKSVNNDSECIECLTRKITGHVSFAQMQMGASLLATEAFKAALTKKPDYKLKVYDAGQLRIETLDIPSEKACDSCEFHKLLKG